MMTAFRNQLAALAAGKTDYYNLKDQKRAHSKSLLFEASVAAVQDYDTIYQICIEGFAELCSIDGRFSVFDKTLFSDQSREEDRICMTAKENHELDIAINSFLGLAAARILLRPAIKAIEWLVRRFR